jgi:ribosomal protein L37AE/L43A
MTTTRWNHRDLVAPDGDLSVAQHDYLNCLHIFRMRDGISREGRQKWECMGCGKKFTEGGQDRGFTIFAKLAPLFAKQYSISKAMRETGHSFYVVRKYFRKMQAIRAGQHKGRPG